MELHRDGWSLREIQHISGHRSLQFLQEYLDIDKEKVVDVQATDGGGVMTSWASERRLELVFDKTLNDVQRRMKMVSQGDRKALRREFQGWFSNDWDDFVVLWLQHFQHWGNQ